MATEKEAVDETIPTPIWFHAVDVPKRDDTPFKSLQVKAGKSPITWLPFSKFDSARIEIKFNASKSIDSLDPTLLMQEFDGLFEVNVATMEFYPGTLSLILVYWDGATYEIRRGIWFEPKGPGGSYQPCEDNLSRQIDDGYRRYMLANHPSTLYSQALPANTSNEVTLTQATNKSDPRWPLFGPYINQFVQYTSPSIAWIQTDEITSKIQRAVLKNSGTKVIRGWNEVEKLLKPSKKGKNDDSQTDITIERKDSVKAKSPQVSNLSLDEISPKTDEPTDNFRQIEHLIFVIHGIGQKLSEHIEAMSFTGDVEVLRSGLISASSQVKATLEASNHSKKEVMPPKGGVQVIPIQWRQKMNVGMNIEAEDEEDVELTLPDILPEGIPGIRMLVSDVIVDVLLYMTPKYRQEMIQHVSSEINRVYRIYKQKNPLFNGTVSIYGHSLGSVIAYDIATTQQSKYSYREKQKQFVPQNSEVDISDLLSNNLETGRLEGLMESSVSMESEQLDFQIDHLYTVGSPIGMFLLLGGYHLQPPIDENTEITPLKHSRPIVRQLYNIFHPYDPVAHRIEPLFSHRMSNLKPNPVIYSKGGITQTVKGIEAAGSEMVEKGKSLFAGLVNSAGSVVSSLSKIAAAPPTEVEMEYIEHPGSPDRRASIVSVKSVKESDGKPESKQKARVIPSSKIEPTKAQWAIMETIKPLNCHGRLDFTLQESILENPYLSSLGVHMNYWSDADVNALIIRSLYGISLPSKTALYDLPAEDKPTE
ncbi:hypothetical protein HDV01_004698 [Terramyces sp. JEL0728]|nr:hypothetical protein HDV01_004685 [Terramyces sp. JEL0728]KAJ3273196.1 hypothetical protein HDV01_004698 [Terramyces sp. JEL0728]